MKKAFFDFAVHICSQSHTTEIVINYTEPNGQVNLNPEVIRLHIKKCCPAVIEKLIENGYSLSMNNGLMSVNKY